MESVVMGGGEGGKIVGVGLCWVDEGRTGKGEKSPTVDVLGWSPGHPPGPTPGQYGVDCNLPSEFTSRFPSGLRYIYLWHPEGSKVITKPAT